MASSADPGECRAYRLLRLGPPGMPSFSGSDCYKALAIGPFFCIELTKAGRRMITARLNFKGNFMSEKIAMSYDQANSKPHLVLGDDALNEIAAGFDDDLAHVFAKKMLQDMADNGFGPKPEDAAAVEEYFYQAYRRIDQITPAG
jgi:hypothetical protein